MRHGMSLSTRLTIAIVALVVATAGTVGYLSYRNVAAADGGREIIRIERTASGEIRVAPDAELQRKGDRPWFKQTVALSDGAVEVSPVELAQDDGKIVVPPTPVVRVSTPVFARDGQL